MKTSEQINEVASALAKAQAAMKPAIKDSENPHFRSKYADLAAVWEAWHAVGPPNGIATVQDVTTEERGVAVSTRLLHTSGQWLEFGPLTVPLAKFDAHGVGSATSYAKRYGLSAAVGVVAEEDDDGNAAVAKPGKGRIDRSDEAMAERRRESAESGPYAEREAPRAEPVAVGGSLVERRAGLPKDVIAEVPDDEAALLFVDPEADAQREFYVDGIVRLAAEKRLNASEKGDLMLQFFGNRRARLTGEKHNVYFLRALWKHLGGSEATAVP